MAARQPRSKAQADDPSDENPERQEESAYDEKLAEAIAEKLTRRVRMSADEFIESIEGIQNTIPVQVRNGMAGVLNEIQGEVNDAIRRRVEETLAIYVDALSRHQKSVGWRIYAMIAFMAIVTTLGGVGVSWWLMPSSKEILRARDTLDSMNRALEQTPVEVFYNGAPYVMIHESSVIRLKNKSTGEVHTYARIIPPTPPSAPQGFSR